MMFYFSDKAKSYAKSWHDLPGFDDASSIRVITALISPESVLFELLVLTFKSAIILSFADMIAKLVQAGYYTMFFFCVAFCFNCKQLSPFFSPHLTSTLILQIFPGVQWGINLLIQYNKFVVTCVWAFFPKKMLTVIPFSWFKGLKLYTYWPTEYLQTTQKNKRYKIGHAHWQQICAILQSSETWVPLAFHLIIPLL